MGFFLGCLIVFGFLFCFFRFYRRLLFFWCIIVFVRFRAWGMGYGLILVEFRGVVGLVVLGENLERLVLFKGFFKVLVFLLICDRSLEFFLSRIFCCF